jgi:hypothetical protein
MRVRKAVIDRIEDGAWAVLLMGKKRVEKIVPVEQLPQGAKEGTRVKLHLDKDVVKEIVVDAEGTKAARRRISTKLEALRKRPRRSTRVVAVDEKRTESETPDEPPSKPDS